MDKSNITIAFIQRINDYSITNLRIPLLNIKHLYDYEYLLIIQSAIENSIKLAIYPTNKEKIIKVSISGLKLSKKNLKEISKILHKFQVIHTSGILKIRKQLFYECYLNLNLSEKGSRDLQVSLNKNENIFKSVKIEEVGLKPNNLT
ncbi:MAG: hypothetical protein ACXABO_06680 [Promethearchaeota archaeon]|jgi:hypothetical protein